MPIPANTVSAAPGPRTRLGALLLRKGLVSPVELEDALEAQRTKGGLLGEILVRSGLASRPAIEDALAEQVGRRVEFEAGFGTGLRSQIASRRPRRGSPVARPHAPAPVQALAVAPAPHPVLEVVPDEPEQADPEPAEIAVVHALPVERDDEPDPVAELVAQAEHWERVADELRDERDAVQHVLAARDRALAEAYAQIEEAAERLVASEHARTDAEEATTELEELRSRLDQLEQERDAARHDLAARDETLADAYVQIEDAAERLAASERARTDAEATAAELEELRDLLVQLEQERDAVRHDLAAREEMTAELAELRCRLDAEHAHRERAEDEAAALRTDLVATELELRLARNELEEARHEPEPVVATAHVVFVRTGARYGVVAADGPAPESGTRLALDERDFLVLKVGRSPFAGDDRPCAFAEPA